MKRHIISLTVILLAACTSVRAASPIDPADSIYSRYLQLADSASLRMEEGRWAEASGYLRTALKLDPANVGNIMLFSNLGLASGMEGKIGESMQCFDIALSRAPRNLTILTSKAKVQIHSGDNEGASETIDTILAIDSVAEWPLQTRGLLRMRNKDFRGAYDDFRRLSKTYHDNSWGPGGMAKCMEMQGHITEATGYYRDAIERCKSNDDKVEFQFGLIENLGHCDRLEEALAVAKEAINANPNDGRLYLLRGWLKKKLLIYREAEADRKLAEDYGVDRQTIERFFPPDR